jgi:hypothetical protein
MPDMLEVPLLPLLLLLLLLLPRASTLRATLDTPFST